MRKYCFGENVLTSQNIKEIEDLTNRIKEEDNMIKANKKELEECKFCKTARKTIKDCNEIIKELLEELGNIYAIKVKEKK